MKIPRLWPLLKVLRNLKDKQFNEASLTNPPESDIYLPGTPGTSDHVRTNQWSDDNSSEWKRTEAILLLEVRGGGSSEEEQ